jgi:hypothetical protein
MKRLLDMIRQTVLLSEFAGRIFSAAQPACAQTQSMGHEAHMIGCRGGIVSLVMGYAGIVANGSINACIIADHD